MEDLPSIHASSCAVEDDFAAAGSAGRGFGSELSVVSEIEDIDAKVVEVCDDGVDWRLLHSQHSCLQLAIPTTSISEQPVNLPLTSRDRTHGSP
jgi:hypothetical protein